MLEEELTDTVYLGVIQFIRFNKNKEEILFFRKDIAIIYVMCIYIYVVSIYSDSFFSQI